MTGPAPRMHPNAWVTVLRAGRGEVAGKTFRRRRDGSIEKYSSGIGFHGVARCYPAPTLEAFEAVNRAVSEDEAAALVLGFFEDGRDGRPFQVWSEAEYRRMAGVPSKRDAPNIELPPMWADELGHRHTARLKRLMKPSTWCLLDADDTVGMPPSIAGMSQDEWMRSMETLIPHFRDAAKLIVPSSSGRLVVDGVRKEVRNFHVYFQIHDPFDLERFGVALLMTAYEKGLGFARPVMSRGTGCQIGSRPWSIFDPTTFSHERLVYDGKPRAIGDGLSIAPQTFESIEGDAVDTQALPTPIASVEGLSASHRRSGGCVLMAEGDYLPGDTLVETEAGYLTVAEYAASDHGHLRCQAVHRPESRSWNAYLGRHESSGSVFLFDNGTRTKYIYRRDAAEMFGDVFEEVPA